MISLVLDNNDSVVNTYIYDPYSVTEHQTGSQYNPYQFAGGYFDSYTLYYKYGTRYYDRFGRWTQQDPQPSANPYVYANDDPVNLTDPSGQYSILCNLTVAFYGFVIGIAFTVILVSATLAAFATAAVTVGFTAAATALLGPAGAGIGAAAGILLALALGAAFVYGVADFSRSIAEGIGTIRANCSR